MNDSDGGADVQSHIESLGSDLVVYPVSGDAVYFYFNPCYVSSSNKIGSDVAISPHNFSYFNAEMGTGREDWMRLRRPTDLEISRFVWVLERMLEHHRTGVQPLKAGQAEMVRDVLGSVVK